MGNNASLPGPIPNTEINKKIQDTQQQTQDIKSQNENVDDLVFNRILDISNDLFMEYHDEYLNENFCNKLAVIYKTKIANLSINLLKKQYNAINSKNVDENFSMEFQYLPKSEDKFFVDNFKELLEENFWYKNVEINPETFISKDIGLSSENIVSAIGYKPGFINKGHVNNLLESAEKRKMNKKKNQLENNKLDKQIQNNQPVIQEKQEEQGEQAEQELPIINIAQPKEGGANLNKKSKSNSKSFFLGERVNTRNLTNEGISKSSSPNNSNRRTLNERERRMNNIRMKLTGKADNENQNNEPKKQEINHVVNKIIVENIAKPVVEVEQQHNRQNQKNMQNRKNKQQGEERQNRQQKGEKRQNNLEILSEIETNVNQEYNEDKFVNKFIKYSVPRNYQTPKNYCETNNEGKCSMTKKDICNALTENFIVRNNIIAAILTTIPQKIEENNGNKSNGRGNSNGKNNKKEVIYEGGICYQKFRNLELCRVCVPYNYRELKDKNINDILKDILSKADYLNEEMCKKNDGYFLKLNLEEKRILVNKTLNVSKEDLTYIPQLKYNMFYIECTEKLKKSYFDNLTLLINILEKMRETAIINNATLNIISNETKNIINNMYNLCHYYYVFAIIALINSDYVNAAKIKEIKLENVYSKVLGTNGDKKESI